MNALKSGEVVTLTVLEQQASKWILTNGVEELPLNASEVTEPLTVGDRLEVFLFVVYIINIVRYYIKGEQIYKLWMIPMKATLKGAFI